MKYNGTLLPAVIPKPKYLVEPKYVVHQPWQNIFNDIQEKACEVASAALTACYIVSLMSEVLYSIQRKRMPRKKKKALKRSMKKTRNNLNNTADSFNNIITMTSVKYVRTLNFIEL